jgi:hypothetical protein
MNTDSVAGAVWSLCIGLRQLNKGQGLGFMIFGSVFDKMKLQQVAMTLGTIIPPVLTVRAHTSSAAIAAVHVPPMCLPLLRTE